ncbi:MAG: membrane-binding protein, partial [Promethearchaeia archaeon]
MTFYNGEWKNDLPHGKGTCTWSDGNVYEGEWKNG